MASVRPTRSTRRQTRLQFQPLVSSPPAKDTYSAAIRDRLAKVRYEGARPKNVLSDNEDEDSLPTPESSSSKVQLSTQNQFERNSPTHQSRAGSDPAVATSPVTSLRTSPLLPPRLADTHPDSSSGSEDDIVLPSSKRRKLLPPQDQEELLGTGSPWQSRNLLHTTPTRRSSRLQKSSPPVLRSASTTKSQRVAPVDNNAPTKKVSDLGSAETSDDDVMMTQPVPRRTTSKAKQSEDDVFVVDDDEVEYLSSGDNVTKAKPRSRKRGVRDDFVVDNDEVEYITSDGNNEQQPNSHSGAQGRLKKSQAPKTPERRSRREQEELEEDLLDLQDSDQDEDITRSRTRGGPVNTQRDKAKEHLELLKKRRAGQRIPRVIHSDDDIQEDEDDYGVDIDNINQEPDEVQLLSGDEAVASQLPIYVDDDGDDDFVIEDTVTEGRLGRPNSDIPLQFTSFASAKPKELFPHIVEWMVKNKISPAFNRNDDVYSISFARVDDQVKAQAGSRLISSAWNATFKHAVLARPSMQVTALPGLDEDNIRTCDACNRSNHPARYDFTFSGKAYSQATLEPIEDSDDSDDSDDDVSDTVSRDEQGHKLASKHTHFYLGRFCAANAEMGHKLTHWKHHLNEQVLAYLEEQDVLSAKAIVSRDKLNKKKREREAENVVDMMRETGMIDELWQAFKDDLEDARIGMEGHERKGGRSKGRIGSVRVQRDNGTVGEWVEGGRFRHIGRVESDDSEGG